MNKVRRTARGWISFVGSISAAMVTAACSAPAGTAKDAATGTGLVGSSWQLVAIRSMDDAQGTTRVSAPQTLSVHFGADGRASFQLECNRGTGSFAVGAIAGSSGELTFGPIAATRALCPGADLGERLARQLPYVRSYLRKDGNLFMSLMADGGILEWQPAPGGTDAKP